MWSEAAAREGAALDVLDIGKPDGRRVSVELGVRTIPAVVIDGTLRAVGTCSLAEAVAMLQGATG